MERIFLFDIDKTIFDTKSSGEKVTKSIGLVTRRNLNEIERINEEYKSNLDSTTDFDSDNFLKLVADKTGVDFETLNQAVFKPENFVLYPETLTVLKYLLDEGYSLGIFSEGVADWQMKKLVLTGVINYFDPALIFIERRKLTPEAINKIPNGVTLVDDKEEVIEKLKQQRPDLELVWVNRKNDEEMKGVRTIKSLTELL